MSGVCEYCGELVKDIEPFTLTGETPCCAACATNPLVGALFWGGVALAAMAIGVAIFWVMP